MSYSVESAKWMGPLLDSLRALGGSAECEVVSGWIAVSLGISDEQKEAMLKSGLQSYHTQVQWARQYLVWEGLLDRSRRGVWTLNLENWNTCLNEQDGFNIIKKWNKVHAISHQRGSDAELVRCKEIALFRYGIISDFVNTDHIPFGKTEELLKFKCDCVWKIPYSTRTNISRTTIFCWIRRYNRGGKNIEALYPGERFDKNKSRVIDEVTAKNIKHLAVTSSIGNVNSLINELKIQHLISPNTVLTYPTVIRFLHQNNLWYCLKARKKQTLIVKDDSEEIRLWLTKVMQGQINIEALKEDLRSVIPGAEIELLYKNIKHRPVRLRNRAVAILAMSKGIPQTVISKHLLLPRSMLYYTYRIYKSHGIEQILSYKRNKVPKYNNKEYVEKLFAILHCPPSAYGFNRTSWNQQDLLKVMSAEGMPICLSGLRKIINNAGYKYRKAKVVLTSNDPQYKAKVIEINRILSNLKENERFFSIDEYGPFAVKVQGGKSLVPPGTTKTVPQWQKSKGSVIVTAALELTTNQVTHFYSENKNTTEMIKLLNILVDKYSDRSVIYFSWDMASWHASKELYKRVDEINSIEYKMKVKSPIVKLAPLPTCAQFLNVIESTFSGMARAIIHNSNYESVQECQNAIDRYFAERNEAFIANPKKAGDKIWGKERAKSVFSDSNNCKDPLYR